MNNRVSRVVCLLLSLQLSCLDALAATNLNYTPAPASETGSGSFKGESKFNKIGNLYGEDLSVVLDGSMLSVENKKSNKTIASAVLFKTKLERRAAGARFSGFCFFRQGEALSEILGKQAADKDRVKTRDGEEFLGTISSLDRNELVITDTNGVPHRVSCAQAEVCSARVFQFSCDLKGEFDFSKPCSLDASKFVFSPTAVKTERAKQEKQTQSTNSRDAASQWSTKKKLIVFTALTLLVATAIAVPLAVGIPAYNNRRNARRRRDAEYNQFLVNTLLRPRSTNQAQPPRRNQNQNN